MYAVQRDHLGIDYIDKRNSLIEAVTLGSTPSASRAPRWHHDPDNLNVVVVGPARQTRRQGVRQISTFSEDRKSFGNSLDLQWAGCPWRVWLRRRGG